MIERARVHSFEFEVGGRPLGHSALWAEIFLGADRPDRLEVEIEEPSRGDGSPGALAPGARVRARIRGAEVFEGLVDRTVSRAGRWEGRRLGIVAYSAYHYRRASASRLGHFPATDSEMAEAVAAALELGALVDPTAGLLRPGISEGDPLRELRIRSRALGFEFAVSGGRLYFVREIVRGAEVVPAPSRILRLEIVDFGRDRGGRGGLVELVGDPELKPLATVALRGFGPSVEGDYRVVRAIHRLDPAGYRTSLEVLEQGLDYELWKRGEARRASRSTVSLDGERAHG